ncbi:hypothetical protein KC19_2G241900 [Ceratodon purpureus]|uniref:Complex 1 LYR protein domain-containing protein n=1 Tax=Ceratodon purpureus TaxID=3225 RepID=A0A8T0J086_CERPU|nr:hypothetical protein KC19_2G241900 [Ceratodon purpureus]
MWRWRAGRRLGLRMLHNGPETLEELVERHVVKPAKGQRHPTAGLTTSRREALGLYREILRTTRLFTWTNEQGVAWRDLLRESARMEYEQARYETDPEIIARLLVVGRDAVQAAIDKVTCVSLNHFSAIVSGN